MEGGIDAPGLDGWARDLRGQADRDARARMVLAGLIHHAGKDAVAVVAACDRMLEVLQDKLPAPEFGNACPFWREARLDARLWAEVASEGQVAAMLVACLDRIPGGEFLLRDREALLAAIWKGLPLERQRAFLAKVKAAR